MGGKTLNDLQYQETMKHWNARNLLMLEAAISAILVVNTPHEAAAILRAHADQLEEYM